MTAMLAPVTLADLRQGDVARIVGIADQDAEALGEVGLHEGCRITVERRLPLGGPVLVDVGPARIAVAREVAARTRMAPER